MANKSVRNERRKLLASGLNTLAGATVTVGALAPTASIVYGMTVPIRPGAEVALVVAIWMIGGVILHSMAQVVLGRIEE